MKPLLPLLCCLLLAPFARANTPDSLEFLEAFAWGDREAALRMLVPNTEEFYFYTALHHQLDGNRDAVATTQRDWRQFLGNRHPSPRYREIERRQRLLEFDRDPEATWNMIRHELGLTFSHRRRGEAGASTLPAHLDPQVYGVEAFRREATRGNAFPRYSTRGLELLDPRGFNNSDRRVLLSRIDRPDFPGLLDLLLADLAWDGSEGFGSLPIHGLLARAQLEELARRRPELLRNGNYVTQRLARMPAPDTNLEQDHPAAVEHFARIWAFVRTLDPLHNSLKASVAYRLLHHQHHVGAVDESLFRAYLELPRRVPYLPRPLREQLQRANTQWVDFGFAPGQQIPLPPIVDETTLVRALLIQFLRDASSPAAYETWFEEAWLGAVFAESKILHGIGQPEEQRPRLSPAQYRALLDRVELDFAPTNPRYLAPGEPVALQIDVKRVDAVQIKLYELQTFNYYATRRQAVDQAVDLDGLVATHERSIETAASPGRRIRHRLEFSEIGAPGVYVVELIGGGVSSRALLHIGRLESVSMATPAGQAVMVLDHNGDHLLEATLWIDGREFTPDEAGIILLPWSENPGRRFAILRHGDFSHPEQLEHLGEAYSFAAGIHIDPQNLPRRRSGQLTLRPDLRINGVPIDPALLQQTTVVLTSVDARGTASSREFAASFERHREWTREFYVPDDLRRLTVAVQAKLRRRTDGEELVLRDEFDLAVNAGRVGDALQQLFFQPSAEGWWLEARGLNGEPIEGLPVTFRFSHPAFTVQTHAQAATDAAGRILLDHLRDIEAVHASPSGQPALNMVLPVADAVLPARLHLRAGEDVSLAHPWASVANLADATLLRIERGAVQELVNDRLRVAEGELRISALPAGEYELRLHGAGRVLRLFAVDGDVRLGYLFGPQTRHQETVATTPSVREVRREDDQLVIRLRNRTPSTRVALRLARYAGPGHAFPEGHGFTAPLSRALHRPYVQYVSGRNIGDEYRYVLDRRGLERFAGTLLARPGLILNPWELRETVAERERLRKDGVYGSRVQPTGSAAVAAESALYKRSPRDGRAPEPSPATALGFDFLPQGSQWIANLAPDDQGEVRIPLAGLAEQTFADIVVLDRFGTSRSRHLLPDTAFEPRDVRLIAGLPPERSFSRQKTIRALDAGEAVTLPDLATSRYQLVRSFGEAYDLLRTLGGHEALTQFAFLKTWPELDDDAKRARYGEFASHELHLFLHARDRAFFDAVVRPYLANKKDPTFVDRWLIEALTPEDLRLDVLQRRNALELALLARRGGDREAVLAALRERVELLPPDPEGFARLVRTALQAADLDDAVAAVRQEARERAESHRDSIVGGVAFDAVAPAAEAMRGRRQAPAPASAAPRPMVAAARMMSLREDVAGEAVGVDAFAPPAEPFGDFEALQDMITAEAPALFRALPKTKEWAEQNYYKVRAAEDTAERIAPTAFWLDVATGTPISGHLLQAHGSLTEVLAALAFSGLPFAPDGAATEAPDGAGIRLGSASPALLVTEQILPAEDAGDDRPLLISQQFYRPDDRYRHEGNEQIEKFVTGEFVRRVVYGGRVTLTNPTANRRRLNVLMQIPRGAVPVQNGFYTDDRDVRLDPYTTRTIEFHFYFPFSGTFGQFAAHAAADEAIIGRAENRVFEVVDALTEVDRTSWGWISQHGSNAEVLAFLAQGNPRRHDLDEMAWRMREREFFGQAAELLASRLIAHDTTLSYAVYHKDADWTRVWLPRTSLAPSVGALLQSPLLHIDPVDRKTYEHLEYDPLVNPRAHAVGASRTILNPAVNQQYRGFLGNAVYADRLTAHDRLGLVYYLLLQDRIGEARDQWAQLEPGALHERLQNSYLDAWMALRTLDLDRALSLAEVHHQHPVPRWRARFAALRQAVLEARGGDAGEWDDPDRQQRIDRAAAGAPALDLRQDGGRILVLAHNLPQATLNLYPMDIELLFSRRPFQTDSGEGFGIVRPAFTQTVELPVQGEEFELELPPEYRDTNLVVELLGRGQRASAARFANRLRVRLIQSFGQLEVRSSVDNEFLPRTYVKVYARGADGRESFWKDGYTDLRGRFDYLSLNDREPEEAVRFSILILHPEYGATLRETTPPTR